MKNRGLITGIGTFLLIVVFSTAMAQETPYPDYQKSYDEHRVKVLFYRWFTFYERPIRNWDHQFEILTPDVEVKSTQGTAKTLSDYKKRVLEIPLDWKNAHHIHNITVSRQDKNNLLASAAITYENINSKGIQVSYQLHYEAQLLDDGSILPRYKRIAINMTGKGDTDYNDAYAENRGSAFLYYWLTLVERNDGNAEPFRELFYWDGLELNMSTGTIRDFAGFAAWFKDVSQRISKSKHIAKNVKIKSGESNTILVSLDFDWEGIDAKGRSLTGKTHHDWILVDDGSRYAKLKSFNVKITEPFRLKQ